MSTKISALPTATVLQSSDTVPIVQSSTTKQAPVSLFVPAARPKFGASIHKPTFFPPGFSINNYTTTQLYNDAIELMPTFLPAAAHLSNLSTYVEVAAASGTVCYVEYYEADSDWQISGAAKVSETFDGTSTGLKTITANVDVAAGAGWLVLGHSASIELTGWATNSAWVRADIQNDRFVTRVQQAYAVQNSVTSISDSDLTYSYNPVWAMGVALEVETWL